MGFLFPRAEKPPAGTQARSKVGATSNTHAASPAPAAPVPQAVMRRLEKMERYRPTTRRQRLGFAGLAVGTTALILGSMVLTDAGYVAAKLGFGRADRSLCAPGQTEDCVGGKTDVIVTPVAPAAGS
jgi:hypothetical protein